MARRPRGLTDDERRLWSQVARTAEPLAGRPVPAADTRPPAAPAPDPRDSDRPSGSTSYSPAGQAAGFLKPFEIGAASRKQAASSSFSSPPPADTVLRMDPNKFKRLKKGREKPEARIDLHGMTLAVAHPALASFILRSHAGGLRLVLVITGKGRGSNGDAGALSTRPGVLRYNVPHWLQLPPFDRVVAQVVSAHDRHGGGGAYYVWLRKQGR